MAMGTLQQMTQWSMTHHPRWLVLLRVALGICLFFKGIIFISNTAVLEEMLSASRFTQNESMNWLSFIIPFIHLLCGFLIIIGLLTRWAVAFQIPILLGAIIFVNSKFRIFYQYVIKILMILIMKTSYLIRKCIVELQLCFICRLLM